MDIKELEKFKQMKWINNLIGINLSNNVKEYSNKTKQISPIIKCNFGTFDTPKLDNNNIYIVVDHSFAFNKNDNIIFIDHHLIGELFNISYASNSELLANNYELIYTTLNKILKTFKFNAIVILIHHDIDGVASGIITKKILLDVYANELDKEYNNKILMAKILGNFGDINPNADVDLTEIFSTTTEIAVYSAKLKLFCKSFSRFMKATRTIFTDLDNFDNENSKKFINYINTSGITLSNIEDIIKYICNFISSSKEIDTKHILTFCNILAINKKFNIIVNIYNEEMTRISNSYICPAKNDSPMFEMTVIFKNDINKTPFKLLIIDTPFDCGRSIIYKYRVSAKYNFNNKMTTNPWSYKLSDWLGINKNILQLDNIACYNKYINKLSLDGNNDSAYNIAVGFGGGGHANTDETGRSLGSTTVDNIDTLLSNCIISAIF